MLRADRDRFVSRMTEQAETGGTDAGELHRRALTEEDRAAHKWFRDLLEGTRPDVRVDAIGNMFARREGTDTDAAPVLLVHTSIPSLRRALRRAARRSWSARTDSGPR